MRVVCISDTHGLHAALHEASPIPHGDVLIHAGDFTDTGDRDEVLAFNAFLATLPHKYKIVIAGNHESTFDRAFYPHNWYNYGHAQQYDPVEVRALLTNALYLEDQAVLLDGFLFYGSPWQPEFCNWAFNLPRGDKLVDKWRQIPNDVDVLITHSPPLGRGDQVGHLRVGCSDLLREVQTRIKPTFHVFGHVHEGYGRSSDGVTAFLNASSCTHEYEAVNAPLVITLASPRAVHDLDKNHAIRYDVMLHEQLRMCSQKPVFVPVAVPYAHTNGQKVAHPHGPCHSHHGAKASLKEFSVDGTTAALLFESTLKIRPVKAKQTRALRYLFHHGFKCPDGDAAIVDELIEDDAPATAEETSGSDAAASTNGGQGNEDRFRERRRQSLARRVTMAVLEELPESSRDAIATDTTIFPAPVSTQPNPAAVATSGATSAPRRARRDKTLQRREAVAKLATMVEEPEKEAAANAVDVLPVTETNAMEQSPADFVSSEPAESETSQVNDTFAPASEVQAPPTVNQVAPATSAPGPPQECIMCKYNVPGHVHVPSESASLPPPPQATPTAVPVAAKSVAPKAKVATPPPLLSTPPAPPATVANAPPAPAAAECILCKYKVAGHVHPGAEKTAQEAAECEQAVEENNEADVDAPVAASRSRGIRPNRLSSWF